MIAFSGVRSSWLMLARNSLLWRLATSSWCDLVSSASNSRAFWMAITAWSAKVRSRRSSLSVNVAFGSRRTAIRPMPRLFHSMGVSTTEKLPIAIPARRRLGGTSAAWSTSAKTTCWRPWMTSSPEVCSSGSG